MKIWLCAYKWMEKDYNAIKTSFRVLILQGLNQKPENNINFSTWKSTATPFLNTVTSEKYHLTLKFLILVVHEK
jgi:hypothetical protein